MHIFKQNKNSSKANSQKKIRPVDISSSLPSIGSPDSTCLDSDFKPSSSYSSNHLGPGQGGQVMSTSDSHKSPEKDISDDTKVTPQSQIKPELKLSSSKRKLFSSPSVSHDEDDKKTTPRRKKFADAFSSGSSTPKSANRLSVPLSERQQMALLMQMTAEAADILPSTISTTKSPKDNSQNRKLNKRNEKGETPLHSATIKGDVKLVKKLIRQGADINIPDFAGWTPLHEACNHGWYEISKQLLRAGATVNVKGLDDDTPLHDASINGHRKLVELLVKSGANPLQANSRGKTPLDIATTDEVKQILKRELILSSSDESGSEEIRSPTSPESDFNDVVNDNNESVHSTSKDVEDDSFQLTSSTSLVTEVEENRTLSSSTMRKTSPQPNNNKGPEKPSSPRLTLRFQSIRAKDCKTNTTGNSSKCVPGVVSSSEHKYQSYFVTMEAKDDIYEFKQDTPPPMPLSVGRITPLTAPSSVSDPCDSQTEVVEKPKDCDSSTSDKPESAMDDNTKCLESEKMDVDSNGVSDVNVPSGPSIEETSAEVSSISDADAQKKLCDDGSSPIAFQGQVSSTSKATKGTSPTSAIVENNPSEVQEMDTDSAVTSAVDKPAAEAITISSGSPQASVATPGSSGSNSGSSSPKVPPLKIVIPQTSEQDSKDKNKSNAIRQALPYVVNSTATVDAIENSVLYSTSNNSQTTDSVRVTYSKPNEQSSCEGVPERTQRVTRSSHRIQAALANVSGNNDSNLDNSRIAPDSNDDPQAIGVHPRKRKLRSRDSSSTMTGNNSESNHSSASSTSSHDDQPSLNCYHMYLDIRRQVDQRRKNLSVVQPKAPQGYKDYLINRCCYVLEGNASSRLSVPMIPPPQSLAGALKELFLEQEKERYKLRLQHHIEKEKLVLSVEQEILRVHTRAARALANQTVPLSICTILKDKEVYNMLELEQEEKDKNVRSRYNGRLFLSWLQDVDDKWEKIKQAMLLRHHNEAESLHAVQKMTWEWKMKEVGVCDHKVTPVIDDLNVPIVNVNDEFDLLPA